MFPSAGTPAVTSRNFTEADMEKVAGFLCEVADIVADAKSKTSE